MKRISTFETSDGVLHREYLQAMRHSENRYGDALTQMAHELLSVEKYPLMIEFLENNLGRFATISELKADCILPPAEEED